MNLVRRIIIILAGFVVLALLCEPMSAAQAAEYCCICKGETAGKTIDSSSRALAIGQCSLACAGYTNVSSGKCAAPPPAPVAAPTEAPAPSAAAGNVVLAYKSEDCSGDPLSITGAATQLQQGIRSFRVDSGNPASAWEKADYAGLHTEFVGPSICVSPGFEIQSIKRK